MPNPENRLRIALCGTRGIPACYGGFETFAEQLSTRLVARGHEVTVYGRKHVIQYREPEYQGVKIELLWAPRHKYLETPVHSMLSLIHLAWRGTTDVILLCNAANSPFLWIPRLRRIPVLINVDGIERMRAKWNSLGKLWYLLGERCAAKFAPQVVSDAEVIRQYYQQTYRRESVVIVYGHDERGSDIADDKAAGGTAWLKKTEVHSQLGVEPGQYLLYVSRLEPENNAHVVIEAYSRAARHRAAAGKAGESAALLPLVIVGDAPYAKEYIRSLHESASAGVIFAGYRFGDAYRELQLGASFYIQATEVGGTHPALVEAMGYANCIIANGTPENREVVGDSGLVYPKNDTDVLARQILELHDEPEKVREMRKKARERARQVYCWDRVCDRYEDLFRTTKFHFGIDNAV